MFYEEIVQSNKASIYKHSTKVNSAKSLAKYLLHINKFSIA